MRKILYGLLVFALSVAPTLADEIDEKLEHVLYPSVRVLSGNGGGSGTVVYSEDREDDGTYETFVMTNHHVIDSLIRIERKWDNLTKSYRNEENNEQADVELFSYANGGATITKSVIKADIVAYIANEDIALLRLDHPFKLEYVAKILPSDKKLRLFQNIYAVGCPLLVDPMFTKGEVTDLAMSIDKKSYIGGTANIIWGNSGGSVMAQFDGVWYFCGIPSRGNVAGNGQAVTYLGYYISPLRIRNFAKSQKLDFLLSDTVTPTECFEAREKARAGGDDAPAGSSSRSGRGYDTGEKKVRL
jgi:hypothetical protein